MKLSNRLILGGVVCLGFSAGLLWAQQKEEPPKPAMRKDAPAEPAKKKGPVWPKEVNGKTLDQWIPEILDLDPSVRQTAMQAVVYFGPEGRKALKNLITELRDPDPALRANAAIAVGTLGLDEKNLVLGVTMLSRQLNDSQAIVRFRAAMALGNIGPASRTANPQLISALKDTFSSWETRKGAAFALGRTAYNPQTGPDAAALRALTDALKDSCGLVRQEALTSILLLGKPEGAAAERVVKQNLQNLLNDRDKTTAIWARFALMRFDKVTDKHLDALSDFLNHKDSAVRTQAIRALGTLASDSRSRIPDLIGCLGDEDPSVVAWAMFALVQMGEPGRKALPDLKKLVAHKDETIRETAKNAIAALTKDVDMKAPEKKK